MISATKDTSALLSLLLDDGASGLFPQAEVYNSAGSQVGSAINMVHRASGLYQASTTFVTTGDFDVVFITYTDAGHTMESGSHPRQYRRYRVGGTDIVATLPYQDGAVWVDAAGGAAGTVFGVNGTRQNPVTTLADAKTIGDANGIRRIRFTGGLQFYTLTQAFVGYEFVGDCNNAFIDTNNQDISGVVFCNVIIVTGSTVAGAILFGCDIGFTGSTTDLSFAVIRDCVLNGTIRVSLSQFIGCRADNVIIDKVNDPTNNTPVLGCKGNWTFRNWQSDSTGPFPIDVEGIVTLEPSFGDGSANANVVITGRGSLRNDGNLNSIDSDGFIEGEFTVRQTWTRATTGGSTMRAIIHLEHKGARVSLPPTAELAIEARDRAGAAISAFSMSGIVAGAKGYFAVDSIPFTSPVGDVITIQAVVSLSGLGDGIHEGRTQLAFPEA